VTALLVVLGYLVVAAYTGGLLYHRTGLDQPRTRDRYYDGDLWQGERKWAGTILGGIFWPVAVIAVLGYRRALAATVRPVVEKEVARALDVEKAQRNERVARLEKQLGLGDGS
jgi:hypothetical protein